MFRLGPDDIMANPRKRADWCKITDAGRGAPAVLGVVVVVVLHRKGKTWRSRQESRHIVCMLKNRLRKGEESLERAMTII